jgi:predicted phage terminase large subunit-like protein
VFPKVSLRDGQQNIDGWALNGAIDVSYFGGGVGGTVIGMGATMLAVTDDLYKSLADAKSETINEHTIEWKQGTHDSRMGRRTCELDIGTRWRKNDVLGVLEEQGRYDEIIRIPALNENGKSFCEDVRTTEQYLVEKETLDREIWMAEYMQQPIESIGLLYDHPFRTYDGNPPDSTYMKTYMVCDPSDTGKDFMFAMAIADRPDGAYVLDVLHTQDNADITAPKIAEMCKLWRVEEAYVETNSMGRLFMSNIERLCRIARNYFTQFTGFHTKLNKEVRIFTRAVEVNTTLVFPSDWANKWPSFYREITNRSREGGEIHDDACDGCTMAIEKRPYNNQYSNWGALKNLVI